MHSEVSSLLGEVHTVPIDFEEYLLKMRSILEILNTNLLITRKKQQ